jgi:hypothetical protein
MRHQCGHCGDLQEVCGQSSPTGGDDRRLPQSSGHQTRQERGEMNAARSLRGCGFYHSEPDAEGYAFSGESNRFPALRYWQ